MTKQEFYTQYKRLHSQWPNKFMTDNPSKLQSIFEMVKDFPEKWMISFVDRMLKTNNDKLNIIDAALAEKKALMSFERTKEILEKQDQISDDALDKILTNLGVDSLSDAIEVTKNKNKRLDTDSL